MRTTSMLCLFLCLLLALDHRTVVLIAATTQDGQGSSRDSSDIPKPLPVPHDPQEFSADRSVPVPTRDSRVAPAVTDIARACRPDRVRCADPSSGNLEKILLGVAVLAAGLILAAFRITRNRTRTVTLFPLSGGNPVQATFESKGFSESGIVSIMRDGTLLTGRWASGSTVSSLSVTTPTGLIMATELSPGQTPSSVAMLGGGGITAICSVEGDFGSGAVNCADSNGRRYAGTW